MRLRLATWNVNSVRLRAEQAQRFIAEHAPDVLVMQEIKCREGEFPREAFAQAGLPHLEIRGQKGWHGVAIASRLPIEAARPLDVCREGHARAVSARIGGVEFHSLYIPAGGDIPDRLENAKFDHKLDFIARLTAEMHTRNARTPIVLAGDFNVAPGEFDVFNHRFMLKVVSHTPIETEAITRLQASLSFRDPVRESRPGPDKLATWWSYRALDFRLSARGLRLDHIWTTPALGWADPVIHEPVRAWERPSDHAPVSLDLLL